MRDTADDVIFWPFQGTSVQRIERLSTCRIRLHMNGCFAESAINSPSSEKA